MATSLQVRNFWEKKINLLCSEEILCNCCYIITIESYWLACRDEVLE